MKKIFQLEFVQRKFILVGAVFFATMGLGSSAFGQFVVFNNGAEVTVSQGCIVSVITGDLDNSSGTIDNLGRITVQGNLSNDDEITGGGGSTGIFNVSGDWENNDVFTSDQSLVNLNGANQNVTGSAVSSFNNLNILGTGIKSLTLDAEVTGVLELNHLELATQGNTLRVLNPSNAAITATTGFISSTGSGRTSWDMNSTDTYVFPLGSSAGTLRVRPLSITPVSSSVNTFAARMANVNPTSEGFDVSQFGPEICFVNDQFYHQIDHVVGSDAADVTQYFDAIQDGDWENGAHWQNVPQWEDMANEVLGTIGSYSTITNANWSDFSQPAFALANALPDVSIAAVSPLCELSAPVTLSATPVGGSFIGNGVSNGIFSPTSAGGGTHTVTYFYTNPFGCTNSFDLDIEVAAAPFVTITSSNNGALELCDGATMDLVATPGFVTYEWSPTETNDTLTVTDGGQYSVTVTDANGCEGTSVIANVTVQPVPVPVATANGPLAFCEGESVTLSTDPSMASYLWDGTNGVNATTVVTESGDYAVTVVNQYGCEGVSNTITVDVTPMIEATIIEVGGDTLMADPPGAGYQWFLNGDPIPGAIGQEYVAIQNGNYTVQYVGDNGCPTESYVLEYTISGEIGIDEYGVFSVLELYPNPGKGEFTIRGLMPNMEDVTIEVTNMFGQQLQSVVRIDNTNEFVQPMNISNYANGIYFIRIRAAESAVTVRYIKS